MPLVKVKPTSPGRRALVKVVTPELHKGEPHWPLVELGVAAWNEIHAPATDASIEVRTASASNALRMIRYQSVKLVFYWALSLGLATLLNGLAGFVFGYGEPLPQQVR